MKSRRRINPCTVAGNKEAADGCGLLIHTVGGGKIDSQTVKHRGETWTLLCSIDEPPSDTDRYSRDHCPRVPQADLDDDFKKQLEKLFGKSTDAKKLAKKQKALAAGVPDDGAGAGSELGERKCGPEATKEEKASGVVRDGEELGLSNRVKRRCYSCNGKWHRPLSIEPPPELIVPITGTIPKPGWFVACRCCYGKHFEEKAADCARCGSIVKCLLEKSCHLCFSTGHFDNRDKECRFYGKELPVEKYPFRRQGCPGIKISRLPSRKKLANKQKELAAEDTVVPGDTSIASPQAKGKCKVADDDEPRRSLRTRGSSSGC